MIAKKANRQYVILPTQVNSYQAQGFDIYDDKGTLVEYGTGKTVLYSDYMNVVNELKALKENGVGQVDKELKIANDELQVENDELKLEIEALKTQLENLELDLEAQQATKKK